MKMINTLVLDRTDLGEAYKDTPIGEIMVIMFPFFNTGVVLHEEMIVFIDDNGDTKILKNRLGSRT